MNEGADGVAHIFSYFSLETDLAAGTGPEFVSGAGHAAVARATLSSLGNREHVEPAAAHKMVASANASVDGSGTATPVPSCPLTVVCNQSEAIQAMSKPLTMPSPLKSPLSLPLSSQWLETRTISIARGNGTVRTPEIAYIVCWPEVRYSPCPAWIQLDVAESASPHAGYSLPNGSFRPVGVPFGPVPVHTSL
jgi:hypothetical protein